MIRKRIKKQAAFLLTASMLMGLSLSAVDSISVRADNADGTPSVSAYASKTDLQSNLGSDSKIILGKKYGSSLEDLEWYVMGEDSGVSGENTAIFAVDNMIPSGIECFNADWQKEEEYSDSMGAYTKKPEKVLPNHYGASDIRKLLRQISGEEDEVADKYKNLFSDAEKDLLNATKVRTDDFRGSSKTTFLDEPNYYTTSDKLYLPAYDYRGKKTNKPEYEPTDFGYFYIGSESDRKSPSDAQWKGSEQDWFWLRSPHGDYYYSSLVALPGSGVDNNLVIGSNNGVRPASNLNLTNVLFASVAAPASNEDYKANIISTDGAMSLRLKGSEGEIGTVTAGKYTIKVERGSTKEPVYLVIQGKNPDTGEDWYWSKEISDKTETISGIEKWSIPASVLDGFKNDRWTFSDCKIWLESPLDSDTSTISYAVGATKSTAPEECNHDYQFVPQINPTRTEPGYKEHLECVKCEKWFMFIAGKYVEVTKEALEIPATGKSSSSGSSGSSSTNNEWIKDSKGWKYRNSYGVLAQGSIVTDANGNKVEKVLWQKIGNSYYAIGSDGYLKTEWVYDGLDGKWYYCDENIGRLSGWFYSDTDGYWYYLSPSTGEMLTGWQSINGKEYYFAGTPAEPTYSFDATTDTWIYSNLSGNRPFGSMYANTVTPDNYTVDASGAWVR